MNCVLELTCHWEQFALCLVLTVSTCRASLLYKKRGEASLAMGLKQMNNPKEQKVLALSFNVPNAITAVRIILVVPKNACGSYMGWE